MLILEDLLFIGGKKWRNFEILQKKAETSWFVWVATQRPPACHLELCSMTLGYGWLVACFIQSLRSCFHAGLVKVRHYWFSINESALVSQNAFLSRPTSVHTNIPSTSAIDGLAQLWQIFVQKCRCAQGTGAEVAPNSYSFLFSYCVLPRHKKGRMNSAE